MGGRTSNESKAKYNAKAYDRINIVVPKGRKEEIRAAAERAGEKSINAYIVQAIMERMMRESSDGGDQS